MEHREIKTPEEIEALKAKSPGGYRNLREVVINEMPEDTLFSTPTTMDAKATNDPEIAQKFLDADRQTCLTYEVVLMPTPAVGHIRNHDEPIEDYLQRRQDFIDGKTKGMPEASLGVAVRMEITNDDVVADSDQKGL